ncbi:DEAD/DEAH box helicase [Jatrophihabitans sp. YIM 134969]
MTTFADLQLRPEVQAALDALGYEEPTPIQAEAIPPLLEGRDVLGQAATGTGKTAAFALPLLERLTPGGTAPQALILTPTRELAIQVGEAVHRYGKGLGTRVLPVYGGSPIGRQIRSLESGVDVVVGTPGRVLDHIHRGTMDLSEVTVAVLDEADEMLDMGFAEDLEAIFAALPTPRQTVLFSATIPSRINHLVKRYLDNPVRVQIKREELAAGEQPRIRQVAYVVPRAHKASALGRLLDIEAPAATIVFARTREEVDSLAETLTARGYRAEPLHGGMTQEARDRIMGRLRNGTADLLVATDVAARGLDVEQLTHVVNYDVPSAPDAYVHRIGRVGRAGREGTAITLVEPRQHRLLKTIEQHVKAKIAVEKVPTVADLRARRLELTRASLRETVLEDDNLDQFRVVLDSLSDDFDVVDIALAAIKLAHEAGGPADDDADIPVVAPRVDDARTGSNRATPPRRRAGGDDVTRLFLGLGRDAHVRPQDIVGAIANESSLPGRAIGAIEIQQRFSVVDIPADSADEVIVALRNTTIKGRKPKVERYTPR